MQKHLRTAIVVALGLVTCSVAQGAAPPVDGGVARFHRYSQGWDPHVEAPARTGSRYGIVILQGAFTADMRRLKRAHPGLRVLLYKNLTQTVEASRSQSDRQNSTVVDYATARKAHPEWFLRDPAGDLITRHYSPGETDYLMDVGSASYAAAAASNLLTQARRDGWDGVFLDDALPTLRYWVPSGSPADVASYPTDRAWSAATRRFLAVVGSRLRANGMMVIANTCCNLTYRQRNDWASLLDGTMDEGFVNPPNGRTSPLAFISGESWNDWLGYLAEVESAERSGKLLLTELRGPRGDRTRALYGLATVLLAADSETSFEYHVSDTEETWLPEFTTALRLGRPLEKYHQIAPGVYRRRFLHGIVLVNAARPGSPARVVPLGGVYSGSGLRNVSSVVLGPVRGLVLAR